MSLIVLARMLGMKVPTMQLARRDSSSKSSHARYSRIGWKDPCSGQVHDEIVGWAIQYMTLGEVWKRLMMI